MIYTRKKGSVLVFSLIVLSIVLSTALSITAVNVSNRKSAASTAQSVQSFQTADTATEKVMKAIYNGNYATLTALYNAIKDTNPGAPASTCPGVLNLAVAGGVAQVKFSDTSGVALTAADCGSVLWRDTLARVKVEGSGSTGGGATRVIEVGIAPLSSMAWGENGSGQLGDGSLTDKSSPVSTIGGSKWKSISAGGSHVLAVRADGTLWAWGDNGSGQLGNNDSGASASKTSPIQIGTDTDWESVSAGASHSLAIKADTNHTLWSWGEGADYQLGRNNQNDRDTPTSISVCHGGSCPAGWKVVSAGSDFSLAIGTDNTLWSWGNNAGGRLGNGENGHRPAQITSCQSACIAGWKAISAGTDHTLAIDGNDNLWAWGSRENGKVGDNSSSGDALSPTPIQAGTTWQSISAGFNHSLGVRIDGTLWAWGRNIHGQLGFADDSNPHPLPVQIGVSTDWKFVFAGNAHGLALKTNGVNQELWAWGYNSNGQVGDNSTTTPHPTLFQVPGNWKLVDGGSTFSIAVRE